MQEVLCRLCVGNEAIQPCIHVGVQATRMGRQELLEGLPNVQRACPSVWSWQRSSDAWHGRSRQGIWLILDWTVRRLGRPTRNQNTIVNKSKNNNDKSK